MRSAAGPDGPRFARDSAWQGLTPVKRCLPSAPPPPRPPPLADDPDQGQTPRLLTPIVERFVMGGKGAGEFSVRKNTNTPRRVGAKIYAEVWALRLCRARPITFTAPAKTGDARKRSCSAIHDGRHLRNVPRLAPTSIVDIHQRSCTSTMADVTELRCRRSGCWATAVEKRSRCSRRPNRHRSTCWGLPAQSKRSSQFLASARIVHANINLGQTLP